MQQSSRQESQKDIEVSLKQGDLTQEKVDAIVNTLGYAPNTKGPLYLAIL